MAVKFRVEGTTVTVPKSYPTPVPPPIQVNNLKRVSGHAIKQPLKLLRQLDFSIDQRPGWSVRMAVLDHPNSHRSCAT